MPILKDRQRQIPNGFRMSLPEVRWQSAAYASFDTIVNQIFGIVNSNPALATRNHWPTTRPAIAQWVDSTNAEWCQQNGWRDYIVQGGEPPKIPAPETRARLASVAGAVRRVSDGAALLLEWEKSGEAPVSKEMSESRAAVCAACPKNGKGDLTRWFTIPASEVVRTQLGRLHGLQLTTSKDAELGICEVCLCPLKLKIHSPLHLILNHMSNEVRDELPVHCWILK